MAIWIAIGLLLVRGMGSALAPMSASAPDRGAGARGIDPASAALAVRFARAYFDDRSPRALAPFFAEGASAGSGVPSALGRSGVTQAEVSAAEELGGGREVLTVACELRDARTLYLAVPVSRSGAGEVAVLGAPWMVAAPSVAGVAAERPRPLAGPEGAAIQALIGKFLPAYLAARSPGDLSYLLAPGAAVFPLAGSLEALGVQGASQLGDGEGPRRTIIASGRFRDPLSGALYKLAYRLEIIKREDRWYVQAVEGALR